MLCKIIPIPIFYIIRKMWDKMSWFWKSVRDKSKTTDPGTWLFSSPGAACKYGRELESVPRLQHCNGRAWHFMLWRMFLRLQHVELYPEGHRAAFFCLTNVGTSCKRAQGNIYANCNKLDYFIGSATLHFVQKALCRIPGWASDFKTP